ALPPSQCHKNSTGSRSLGIRFVGTTTQNLRALPELMITTSWLVIAGSVGHVPAYCFGAAATFAPGGGSGLQPGGTSRPISAGGSEPLVFASSSPAPWFEPPQATANRQARCAFMPDQYQGSTSERD